jgi:hypothetical protein
MEEGKVKTFNEIEKISCPHCGEEQGYESCDNGEEFITCWGEESIEKECHSCGKIFFVQEIVIRDWEVAKKLEDF